MCVVSMVMDHYWDKWSNGTGTYKLNSPYSEPAITDEEIREFRKLLERAREYDKRNNEPDCELEEKKQRIKDLATQLGVKIDFL